ncbi:CYTH domain protein [Pseudoxanthomonas broegbernensis]|uniref:CYTH domain protein n=1 Tax=Pseudoxanthomonas broegbernensis TaxID=83619 RepID=A0A7V8K8A3_9GAMM|nr:CYTH domain-containing protein [Pseudoxanthomonas broegbernensis]KAF1688085.1 CYTH domain protein [Pseudoxanthomonas broegbernensis]MBB6065123.1 adenylate cyclase [Pseudoxanthomonas broegbernensis]
MAIEIERKFKVRGDGWKAAAERVQAMAQGYLNGLDAIEQGTQNASVRVRIEGGSAFLNLKSRQLGRTRHEFDYPVPVEDARQLLELCVGGRVEKRRHYVRHAGHLWEVDEFLGDNAGLVVAEIELDSPDEGFARPDWLGEEVTDQPRYYNLALAARPYSRWSAAEREGCLS